MSAGSEPITPPVFNGEAARGDEGVRRLTVEKSGEDPSTATKDVVNTRLHRRSSSGHRVSVLTDDTNASSGAASRAMHPTRKKSSGNVNFLNNVVDFLCTLYGRDVVDKDEQQEPQPGPDASIKEGVQNTPLLPDVLTPQTPCLAVGGDIPVVNERHHLAQRQHPHTHYGFISDRPRILSAVPMGRSVSEDRLQFIVEQILDGYRRINDKSRATPQGRHSLKDACNNVSVFVNHAVDNLVVREASFSLAETRSNQSILSTAYDGCFQTPLTFRTFSEIGEMDEESEVLIKPDFHAVLPTFEKRLPDSCVSVSAPIRMRDDQPMPEDATINELEIDSTPLGLRRRQRSTNSRAFVSFLPSPREREVGTSGWSEMNMSLQSNGVDSLATTGSWETAATGVNSLTDTAAQGRSESDGEIARFISREEIERCVLVSVEGRFRTHINSLKKHELLLSPPEAEKIAATRRSVLSAVNASTTSPMVQNIIEFFSN
ncbi:hypothetical protein DPX39_040070800 [Trypanosoma brucei equiperdum]|uniref:Uncharacterized protein n=1 Tax=Trypanosoma brucei equiperdum TaxID=630700 RepID=A0A3L6LDE1_9TRYP|nr:hypothetical protein DPX39_040070800 [Trypanosoma brucei equiperdum]